MQAHFGAAQKQIWSHVDNIRMCTYSEIFIHIYKYIHTYVSAGKSVPYLRSCRLAKSSALPVASVYDLTMTLCNWQRLRRKK